MPRYRKVDPRIWNDEKFKALADTERLAWLYLLTCQDANSIGLYHLSLERMSADLNVDMASVRRSIGVLTDLGMLRWDEEQRLAWLPRWIDYNPPAGTNQVTGYISVAEEFLPHPYAVAFRILMAAVREFQPGETGILSQRQAVLVRDGVACAYCKEILTCTDDFDLDYVVPSLRAGALTRYENLVASCKSCSRKKAGRTAEEFGFPFVGGRSYSIGDAVLRLLREPVLRANFSAIYHGLPSAIAKVEEVSDLLADRTAFERRKNGVVTQEQEQEQEQRAGAVSRNCEQEQDSLAPSKKTSAPKTRPRDLAMDHFAETCLTVTETPYVIEKGDGVMLHKLRTAFKTANLEMPPGWQEAVENYFASALGQYSLADLANPKRYAVFRHTPLDGYKKPINHRSANGELREERIARENRETAELFNRDTLKPVSNGNGTEDHSGASRALLPRIE